jgi:acyl carrier protein
MALDRDSLLDFLRTELDLDEPVADDTPLFSGGLLDSFAMVTLVGHVEKSAGIRLSPGDVNLNNLDTIDRILRLAERKKAK